MKRVEPLTFLRFLAALIVVIFHFGRNTKIGNFATPFIYHSGATMVTFFFVLSGFVMIVAYYNKNNGSMRDYYITRIARIVPIYMLSLFLCVFLFYGVKNNNMTALLLHLTFLQSWFPPYPLSLNSPAWSLSVEAFFYITFPFILLAIKKSNISCKKLMIIALLFYFFTQAILSYLLSTDFYRGFPSASYDLIYFSPPSHYCSFILGVAGGYFYLKHTEWFNQAGLLPFVILSAIFFLNYIVFQKPTIFNSISTSPLAYDASFYSLLFLLLILSFAYSKSFITKIMSMPIFVLLGESSYSLYILQVPLYEIYSRSISNYLFKNAEINPDGDFCLFVFLLVVISMMSFYFIEKPGKKIILKFNEYLKKKAY